MSCSRRLLRGRATSLASVGQRAKVALAAAFAAGHAAVGRAGCWPDGGAAERIWTGCRGSARSRRHGHSSVPPFRGPLAVSPIGCHGLSHTCPLPFSPHLPHQPALLRARELAAAATANIVIAEDPAVLVPRLGGTLPVAVQVGSAAQLGARFELAGIAGGGWPSSSAPHAAAPRSLRPPPPTHYIASAAGGRVGGQRRGAGRHVSRGCGAVEVNALFALLLSAYAGLAARSSVNPAVRCQPALQAVERGGGGAAGRRQPVRFARGPRSHRHPLL